MYQHLEVLSDEQEWILGEERWKSTTEKTSRTTSWWWQLVLFSPLTHSESGLRVSNPTQQLCGEKWTDREMRFCPSWLKTCVFTLLWDYFSGVKTYSTKVLFTYFASPLFLRYKSSATYRELIVLLVIGNLKAIKRIVKGVFFFSLLLHFQQINKTKYKV